MVRVSKVETSQGDESGAVQSGSDLKSLQLKVIITTAAAISRGPDRVPIVVALSCCPLQPAAIVHTTNFESSLVQ
jgi:hypothetical protein